MHVRVPKMKTHNWKSNQSRVLRAKLGEFVEPIMK